MRVNHLKNLQKIASLAKLCKFHMSLLTFSAIFSTTIFAADLMDIYHHALQNDPTFKAAFSSFLSKAEAIPQARAALMPQIGLGAQKSYNQLTIIDGPFAGTNNFTSQQLAFNASQALFNMQAWDNLQQAKAQVKAAQAQFNDASQNLILYVTQAYVDALLSKDTLTFAEAKKRANKRQLEQARNRFDVGVDTITSVYEAKAAYDQSIAEVIAAQNNQINKNENLRKLTNQTYEVLAPLRNETVPLNTPEPNNVDDWIASGLKQNYKLFAAQYNLQAARENIKSQSTGNWPTVALQGSSTRNTSSTSGNDVFAPAGQVQSNIALAVNFPIYQGGLTETKTRQAQYDFQTISEQLEQIYRNVIVNSRIAFNTIVDGASKVKADRQTIISQQNSLESTEAQYQVGTRTMVDVTRAQQSLFQAQVQLASDQYLYIMSILNLKYLAGSLNVLDIQEVNSWLETTRINGTTPKQSVTTHPLHQT
jgi:outer membrane protein